MSDRNSSSKLPLTRRWLRHGDTDTFSRWQHRFDTAESKIEEPRNTKYHPGHPLQVGLLFENPDAAAETTGLSVDSNCNHGDAPGPQTSIHFEDQPDLGPVRAKPPQDPEKIDFIPESTTFTFVDLGIYVFSIVSYLADVGSDIWVAYLYFHSGDVAWFSLTVVFILVPAVTMSSFSMAWYLQDHRSSKQGEKSLGGGVSHAWWMSRSVFHFLQITPVIRYIECLVYGLRSKRKRTWYMMLVLEDTDAALLRLIECFMEAAPQLVLQLYILTVNRDVGSHLLVIGQVASCITSLASVSWALTSYHRALRLSLDYKANITLGGMVVQFCWYFFTIGARVIALAMFAAAHRYWVFVVAACHWLVMFVWILVQHTKFCYTRCQELCFNLVTAIIFVFCYFNLLEGHTRLRYILYHALMYAENAGLMLGWYAVAGTGDQWYVVPALVGVMAGYVVGMAFQVLYYFCCHPNNLTEGYAPRQIRTCVPCHQLYICQSQPSGTTACEPENREPSGTEAAAGEHKPSHEKIPLTRVKNDQKPRDSSALESSDSTSKLIKKELRQCQPPPDSSIPTDQLVVPPREKLTDQGTDINSSTSVRLSPSQWKLLRKDKQRKQMEPTEV